MVSKSLMAKEMLDEIKKCSITHIICLPDSKFQFLYKELMNQHEIILVPICREGEAIGIAVGLTLGGKNPVVIHQNTGLFEAGDSIRDLGLGLQLPLLLIIGYRGWKHDAPLTDSAAIYTEPILDAWGIKHYLVETIEDLGNISKGYKETHETNKPVAVLIG